jgi:starvation-inducible DNA-binding protein
LHLKFEELYNEAALHIDELAERQLSIGGSPVATMKEYLELSPIKEAEGNESAETMVQSIIGDYGTVIGELKEGMDVAQ